MNEKFDWLHMPAAEVDQIAEQAARDRQASLTKPPGSLGQLEALAIRLAGLQAQALPRMDNVQIAVFVGDHGVAAEGVSAFPQAVTAEMVKNFAAGGAAISVLARSLSAELKIINLGTVSNPGPLAAVTELYLGAGTANFCEQPAMTEHQLALAINAGRQAAQEAKLQGMQLFIGGEMGIANTTAAAALACGLLDLPGQQLAGSGTGMDSQGVLHKAAVIDRALALHHDALGQPRQALECLRHLGGFEIAALVGVYLSAAHIGLPVLVDGFICSVAALVATRLCPEAANWFIYAHHSAEQGHSRVLDALDAQPLLNLGLRLGEASGAAVALPMLRLACELHRGMASFAEAGVSEQDAMEQQA